MKLVRASERETRKEMDGQPENASHKKKIPTGKRMMMEEDAIRGEKTS